MEYQNKQIKEEFYELKDEKSKYILEIRKGVLEGLLPGGCGGIC